MAKRLALFSLILLGALPLTALGFEAPDTWHSHEFELYTGEDLEVSDYTVEYTKERIGTEYVEFLNFIDTEDYTLVKRFGEGTGQGYTSFSSAYGQDILLGANISIAVRIGGRFVDSEGEYIEFTLLSEENIFASSNLTTNLKKIIAHPGDSLSFSLTLENTGFEDEEYTLSEDIPEGWTARYTYLGFEVLQIPLDSGEKGTISATFKIPKEAETGNYTMRIYAQDGSISELPITVLIDATAESEFSTTTTRISSEPGTTLDLLLTLKNTGYLTETFQLSAQAPRKWDVSFEYNSLETSEIQLEGQDSGNIKVKITIPYDVEFGKQVINISAKDISEAELPIEITVEGESNIDLSLSKAYMKAQAGAEETITAKVYNRGTAAIHNVELVVTVPSSDWSYLSDPISIERIDGGDMEEFELTFSIPPAETTGDKFIEVYATSDEKTTDTSELRVNIEASNTGVYLGVVVLLFAGGAFYWVIKKQGRR